VVQQRQTGPELQCEDDGPTSADPREADARDAGAIATQDPEELTSGKKKASAKLTLGEVEAHISANTNSKYVSNALLLCLIWKESGFDPTTKSSASSATGLMQMTTAAVADVNRNTPKGVHFEHSEMTDPALNIACGTYYLDLRIDRAGTVKAGLNGFGTGPGYADNILTCEKCVPTAQDKQACLNRIHS